jgi:hypothetical protein
MNRASLGLSQWSVVKILGKIAAKAKTSNSTSSSKVKNCPYAKNAGAK